MTEEFKDLGGAASSNPNAFKRWTISRLMSYIATEKFQEKQRVKAERVRKKRGEPHTVHFFYQLDDAYSHLAAQLLPALGQRYDIELNCHLVSGAAGDNAPEPELLLQLALRDSQAIAPHYGLNFPDQSELPPNELIEQAGRQAAALLDQSSGQQSGQYLSAIGDALWRHDSAELAALEPSTGLATKAQLRVRTDEGNRLRDQWGHYSGAMFYYGGEWYWGVDRLYHLEARLQALGLDRSPGLPMLAPRQTLPDPAAESFQRDENSQLTLEIFPSLRSPYTAIIYDRARQMARDCGITLISRPVLPMVMRGVPATRQKGMYIFKDTAREARAAGAAFGPFYDPIGQPVKQAYALYPWARSQNKAEDFISAFLNAAFARGINTLPLNGLKKVVEQAGLDWNEAKNHLGDTDWKAELEDNRLAMYESGLWGVPSFRLLDANGQTLLALWGQDRLWLFARGIQDHLKALNTAGT